LSVGLVIQARMGSSRLPGKVLKKLGDKSLLGYLISRLFKMQNKVKIVIATSNLDNDDKIESFCKLNNISCFRGDEENVLERYYLCAKKEGFEHIIRLTGDNPFIDIEELDNLIDLHLRNSSDYSRSFAVLPKGVGGEIFTFEALEISYKKGHKENHIEHVNEYIEGNKDKFKISELKVDLKKNRPEISLTVDTLDDYKKACFIVNTSRYDYITTEEAIFLCSQFA
jgi:spore coat polysaccharide biosynthesis protein SpsF